MHTGIRPAPEAEMKKRARSFHCMPVSISGSPGRIRTNDLVINSHPL